MPGDCCPALSIRSYAAACLLKHLLHVERLRYQDNTDGAFGQASSGALLPLHRLVTHRVHSEAPQMFV